MKNDISYEMNQYFRVVNIDTNEQSKVIKIEKAKKLMEKLQQENFIDEFRILPAYPI